jgi:glycerophosphoryl diester phosphodiesterase
MRFLKKIMIILSTIFIVWVILILAPKPQNYEGVNVFKAVDGKPLIIAHQGGKLEFPESTLEAYYHAYSVNKDVVFEADLVMTKDEVLIISHDTTLDRVTDLPPNQPAHEVYYSDLVQNEVNFAYNNPLTGNNGIKVSDVLVPYVNALGNEVTPLDVNYPIGVLPRHNEKFLVLSLYDLLTLFPNQRLILEVKQTGDIGKLALEVLIDLLDELDEDYQTYSRIMLSTFHQDVFDQFVKMKNSSHSNLMFAPQQSGVLSYYVLQWLGLTMFYNLPVASLAIPMEQYGINLHRLLFIRTAQRHNIAVHYWTVNNPKDIEKLICLGVDGIITDHVTRMNTLLNEVTCN